MGHKAWRLHLTAGSLLGSKWHSCFPEPLFQGSVQEHPDQREDQGMEWHCLDPESPLFRGSVQEHLDQHTIRNRMQTYVRMRVLVWARVSDASRSTVASSGKSLSEV